MPLILSIITALPTIQTGVEHLIAYILAVRGASGQSKEWSQEAEEAFIKALAARMVNPAYQPDKPD